MFTRCLHIEADRVCRMNAAQETEAGHRARVKGGKAVEGAGSPPDLCNHKGMAGLGRQAPLPLPRGDVFYLGDPVPTAACTPRHRGERTRSAWPVLGGTKTSTILQMCIKLSGRVLEALPHSRNTGLSLSQQGAAGGGAGGAHILSADLAQPLCSPQVWEEFLAMPSPRGAWQRQPGIWCLQFFRDKWRVSTEPGRNRERAGLLITPRCRHPQAEFCFMQMSS